MAFLNFKVFSLKGRGKGDLSNIVPSEVELLSQYFEDDDNYLQAGDDVSLLVNDANYISEAPDDGSQYVRKNEAWDKLTTYSAVNPVSTNNVAGGFPLGSDWYNTVTGEKFYQKANGVWISYTATTTPPTPGGDSPVMFADYATNIWLPDGPTYYNGPLNDGVGATLTASAQTKLYGIISSTTPLYLGQTVLVKDEMMGDFDSGQPSDKPHNGVYIVTEEGCSPTDSILTGCMNQPWVLTRVDYADEPGELYPSQVNILSGVNENRFFLQKNVINDVGTEEVEYEINYVPPTQVVTLPVIHMDTVTTAPLPSCIYTDEFPPSIPGVPFLFSPTTSYLTATVNGPLGVINGVNVTNSIVLSNRKILVKNQADNKQNGDYEIIQNGSASQPWKLRRITTTYSSFNKNTREWKINNEACTLYGNRYYMNYNNLSIGTIGTTPITFSELDYLEPAPVDGSQYVRKDNAWDKLTTYSAVDPTAANTITAGFPLGSDWFNTVSGEKFYHKADGVWISYTSSVTPPTPGGDSPVMFADYATTIQLDVFYDNGLNDDGIGAQLFSVNNEVLIIDGGTVALGDTILVKNQDRVPLSYPVIPLSYQNGVYEVTQLGSLSQPWNLTRVDYADEPNELFPSQVNVLKGSTNRDRFFLQQTENPVLGVSSISYQINYVPPTQTVVLPVIHVDTVTSVPLPSCTYLDEFSPPIGGFIPTAPTTSYLTATANGPLGIINGVDMSISFTALRNRKILVKDQVNTVENGDYEVIQIGNSTTPWKLKRITTTWSSFDKNVREWKVNNELCNFYGNRYYKNSTSPFGIIGSAGITFSELSAKGFQNLQEVTDNGNTTTNDIQFDVAGVGVIFDNGSRLKEGTIDAGYGGSKGIAQICAVGYELKWEAGRLYVMGDGGTTIREVSHNFATTPTVWDDETKGFVFKSRWILDNGSVYTCYDATAGAAVWILQTVGNQDLQNVTDNGNTTTNNLVVDYTKGVVSPDGKKAFEVGTTYARMFAYDGTAPFPDTEARVQVEANGAVVIQGETAYISFKSAFITGQDSTFKGLEYNADYSLNFIDRSLVDKGYVDGELIHKADLVGGIVPSSQLPAYIDEVIEGYYSVGVFYSDAGLTTPITGEISKIYVDLLANKSYRWSGSVYIQISNAISSIDELTDVTVSSPLNGQLLQYDTTTSQWENKTVTVGNGDMQKSTYDIDNDGIVDFAETVPVTVRNPSVSDILRKGTIVYLNGATGWRPNAYKAQANAEATSSGTFGVVLSDIGTNSDGTIATLGTIHTLNTSNTAPYPFTADVLVDGDILWLDPNNAGYVTKTKPQAPNHAVFIGVVARTHPNLGRIVYRITNGYELDELHNVFINGTLANNHVLYYDSATSLWKTKTIAGVLGYTPQAALTVTTVGTSGPATLSGGTLNIPEYSGGGGGTVDINIINATKLTLMYNT